MGAPSKLSEDQWEALFHRDAAGEARKALAREHGITVGTIAWQAAKRSKQKGQVVGAVDKRRRPPGGWPADRVHPQSRSGMTPARWEILLTRRLAGEATEALAAEYGVHPETIAVQARHRGMRKGDRPEAVFLPRGPAAVAGGAGVAFDFRPHDPAATEASLMAQAGAAAAEGRAADFLTLRRLARAARDLTGRRSEREAFVVGSRCDPPPPHKGEGEHAVSPALILQPAQIAPAGDWRTWLFLGGRGAGKTLAGASWLAEMAERCGRLALVGPTLHDVREVMIGGPSGLMALDRWGRGARPAYAPSRRRLVFPNGAEAHVFSAEDPDSLRGPQFAAAWADEYAAWGGRAEETLAMLRMGLRLPLDDGAPGVEGARAESARGASVSPPRLCVTTTPRPTAAMRRLRGEAGLVETRAATAENAEFLAPGFLEGLNALYGGTRRAAQELEGKVVEAEGSLFTAEMMERASADGVSPADFERVVVAVDPTATAGGCACGIVVVGRSRLRGNDDVSMAWVLDDRSAAGLSPQGWAARAVRAADDWKAQAIVAETNQGGEMVAAVLAAAGAGDRYRPVRASVGKRARAEPVAALYEQGRVRHARRFEALEEELMALGEDGGANDRADALVWAVTELMLGRRREGPRVRTVGEPAPLRGCLHDSLWSSPFRVRA